MKWQHYAFLCNAKLFILQFIKKWNWKSWTWWLKKLEFTVVNVLDMCHIDSTSHISMKILNEMNKTSINSVDSFIIVQWIHSIINYLARVTVIIRNVKYGCVLWRPRDMMWSITIMIKQCDYMYAYCSHHFTFLLLSWYIIDLFEMPKL